MHVAIFLFFLIFKSINSEELLIYDEIHQGTFIGDLAAKFSYFPDKPEGKVTYQLLSGGPFTDYLYIDGNNGKLFSKKKIDRDSLCMEIGLCCKNEKLCSIPVSVAVMTASSKTIDPIIRKIQINIEDKNDHKPIFEPPTFNLSILESCAVSTVFPLPVPIDKDSDKYSVKMYKLFSKNDQSMFSLETQFVDKKMTALIRLKNRLDREDRDHYTLTVTAIDGGETPLSGSLIVSISVTDVNDNPPVFESGRQNIMVNESQISNEPLIQLKATDKDIGENAEIFYKLDVGMSSTGSGDIFRVDLLNGYIYMVSSLDYEKEQSYKLIVTASNRQPGVGTATTTISVNVININDEKPVIFVDYLNNRQHAVITEHVSPPKFVSIVSVSDKDIGVAGKVQCRLENYNELFDLSPSGMDQYKIHTRQQLDREIISRYSLSVICQDQGSPPLSADVIIPVIIMDENDNKPEINSQIIFHISENKPAGTVITKIIAFDKDDGLNGKLTYSISDTHGLVFSYLSIDSQTGTLTTNKILDREATNPPLTKINFLVTVSDSGTPKQSSVKALQLIIDDENDNAPQFTQTVLRFSVTENETPVYKLGQIEVSDPDEIGVLRLDIAYSKLTYRKCPFSLMTEKNRFWLMTTESLNWEAQSLHELIIKASDGTGYKSHVTSATVLVSVIDVNDNAPVFIFPRPKNGTTQTVSYRQQPGFVLLTVSATDKDNPAVGNGKFYFSIHSDTSQLFNIDPNQGRIRTHRQMTLSDVGEHLITLKVEDHGSPPLSSDLKIKIVVLDTPAHFNENGNEYDPSKYDHVDSSGSIFSDKESIFVFGLVLILLIVMICICFVVYVRHMKGWLVFLPDLISICHYKEDTTSKKGENLITDDHGAGTSPIKYCANSNYYHQRYNTASPQPNFSQSPEMFIKNGRDCYEVLKCPQDIQHDPCQIPIIHEQQYNDLLSTTMMPPFQSSYLTLHQYPNEYPMSKENVNIQHFSKSLKLNSMQNTASVGSLNSPEKVHPSSFISSKASYAVSFPTEQSTFV